ncbi:MAG: hypothetical protein KDJ47_14070 [Hyphomicrobiaceae bacterium]|nr:hypothetical protein [Hyphomicrobiaceae bacterium]
MPGRAQRAISRLIAIAMAAGSMPAAPPRALAAVPELTRAQYEACQTQDDAAFRSAIADVTEKALSQGIATVDFAELVKDQWREGNLDRIVDARVDIAVASVRDETSWGTLIKSLGSKEKAQELAVAVAERVYRSDAMKTAIEGLAAGVARDIGRQLELATAGAADPTARCLEAYLGPRYGTSVAGFVTSGSDGGLAADGDSGAADVSPADILKQSSAGITGVAVLVLRRQMANVARRLGQRLVGSVLSRLVSVAAGGVGLVLIAKDIWDLRHGVLPIIADEMKSEATKDKVRAELANVLSEQIHEHVKEIANKSADHIVGVWQSFRRAHAKVLELSETNERFKTYFNGLAPAQLSRLDAVVALIMAEEGEAGIVRRLEDGTLDQAVAKLPAAGMEIAGATRSLETGLKWSAVAGDNLQAVVSNEIYQRARPQDFSSASLQRLLDVGDRLAITRLASVQRAARDTLFELGPEELKSLARSLTERELGALAGYLSGLQNAPRARVLKAVASEPGVIRLIAPERVRTAVLSSRDQMAAVDMMLRPQGVLDPVAAYEDMQRAWEGRVSPLLVWEKHPAGVIILGILALFVLLVIRRLLLPRRSRALVSETTATSTSDGGAGIPPTASAPSKPSVHENS